MSTEILTTLQVGLCRSRTSFHVYWNTDNITGRIVKAWDKLFVCWNTALPAGKIVQAWDKLSSLLKYWQSYRYLGHTQDSFYACLNTDNVTDTWDIHKTVFMPAEILTTLQMPRTNTSFYVCWNIDNVRDAWDKYKFLCLLIYWQHYKCLGQVFMPAEILTKLQISGTRFHVCWNTDKVTDA